VVSDATGVLEHHETALEHACVTCALREDIVPALERLARDGRWSTIVACLPTATEAHQLATVLTRDSRLARHLQLSSIITALGSEELVEDLLGDALLHERGLHTNPADERGLGEVGCAQIEHADVIVLADEPGAAATDLVRALVRPDALLLTGADQLDGSELAGRRHQHKRTMAWSSPGGDTEIPALGDSLAWRLDLSTPRPFHPERLLDQIGRLGTGRHRSRGCFWVPTRPGAVQEWAGAGGQLSIGHHSTGGGRPPLTRLVFTGLGATPVELVEAFEDLLITPAEALWDQSCWKALEDGLEPWLGDIRDAA
jgi:G3E family GTPase